MATGINPNQVKTEMKVRSKLRHLALLKFQLAGKTFCIPLLLNSDPHPSVG